jgi:hypothetical protein
MAERKVILTVSEMSDDDCGIYKVGEIDCDPSEQVQRYIDKRGEYGYHQMLEFIAILAAATQNAIQDFRHKKDVETNAEEYYNANT